MNNSRDFGQKTVIYGYSSVGEAVYQELKRRNIDVACFCDDNTIKIRHAKSEIAIYTFNELIEKGELYHFIISIPNAEPLIEKIEKYQNMEWELCLEYLVKERYEKFSYSIKDKNMAIREVESCIFYHKGIKHPEKIFLRNIDLEITEKCSLRCYNCCNLMQYYKKPKDYSVDKLLMDIQDLLKYIDEIYEVRILGGEPFMHKNIKELLEKLILIPQIKRIVLLSNATIIPDDSVFYVMQSEKVGLSFTNYGKLSRSLEAFCKKLDEFHISYDVHEMGGWTLCSEIAKHNRSIEELEKVYCDCCAKNLLTLLDGKLYKCPFIANAMNLKAIPNSSDDAIVLKELEKMKRSEAKEKINYYIKEKRWFVSCDYCLGRDFGSEEIEPAVQTSRPRDYYMYEG